MTAIWEAHSLWITGGSHFETSPGKTSQRRYLGKKTETNPNKQKSYSSGSGECGFGVILHFSEINMNNL
jgi:hypothetical protein